VWRHKRRSQKYSQDWRKDRSQSHQVIIKLISLHTLFWIATELN
jgi:hypothetical protein